MMFGLNLSPLGGSGSIRVWRQECHAFTMAAAESMDPGRARRNLKQS